MKVDAFPLKRAGQGIVNIDVTFKLLENFIISGDDDDLSASVAINVLYSQIPVLEPAFGNDAPLQRVAHAVNGADLGIPGIIDGQKKLHLRIGIHVGCLHTPGAAIYPLSILRTHEFNTFGPGIMNKVAGSLETFIGLER